MGEPIVLHREVASIELLAATGYGMALLNSGTAALSLAISLAARRSGCAHPEVILPAYGCPDLLAAAVYAGVAPVLVDIEPRSPRYQRALLASAINANTVAIVAVNFLGIAEDLAALRALAPPNGALLIEDNAQFVPLRLSDDSYRGDLVVHSFGRGKPIAQVGGGALLYHAAFAEEVQALLAGLRCEVMSERAWRMRARLFNAVLHPLSYQWLLYLPFLRIGVTEYKPLQRIERLAGWRNAYLQVNLDTYLARSRALQQHLHEVLAKVPGIVSLPLALASDDSPLLRYPLLCADRPTRDALLCALQRAGLGATSMYGRPLPDVDRIPFELAGDFSGAAAFADCLLTLPVTSRVNARDVRAILAILRAESDR